MKENSVDIGVNVVMNSNILINVNIRFDSLANSKDFFKKYFHFHSFKNFHVNRGEVRFAFESIKLHHLFDVTS